MSTSVRTAILLAADHIERNPAEFDFGRVCVPSGPGCGSPGCALGWIGAFGDAVAEFRRRLPSLSYICEAEDGVSISVVANNLGWSLLGVDDAEFYTRMSSLDAATARSPFEHAWIQCPKRCALILRRYADTYHPVTDQMASLKAVISGPRIPDDVRSQEVTA